MRRALSPLISLPGVAVTPSGSRFLLGRDPIDDAILEDVLGPLRDVYFPMELTSLPAPLILEIGAHSGIVAVELLRRVRTARLIALEPSAQSFARLRRNLRINGVGGRSEIYQAALSADDGVARLRRSREGSWGDSINPGANEPAYLPGSERVRAMRLESVLGGRTPDVIICNGEGAEFMLVPQMLALRLRPAVLVLMTHSRHAYPGPLLLDLERHGFSVAPVGILDEHFHCRPRSAPLDRAHAS